jgi:large subunit ribosomal protein L2
MVLFKYQPCTPGRRNKLISQFKERFVFTRYSKLTYGYMRAKGRNHRGIITSRHRGGGHKRLYREIDFKRKKKKISGRVISIEYDPNRNSRICLIDYDDGEKKYILQPRGIRLKDQVIADIIAPILPGNALPLSAV